MSSMRVTLNYITKEDVREELIYFRTTINVPQQETIDTLLRKIGAGGLYPKLPDGSFSKEVLRKGPLEEDQEYVPGDYSVIKMKRRIETKFPDSSSRLANP